MKIIAIFNDDKVQVAEHRGFSWSLPARLKYEAKELYVETSSGYTAIKSSTKATKKLTAEEGLMYVIQSTPLDINSYKPFSSNNTGPK